MMGLPGAECVPAEHTVGQMGVVRAAAIVVVMLLGWWAMRNVEAHQGGSVVLVGATHAN